MAQLSERICCWTLRYLYVSKDVISLRQTLWSLGSPSCLSPSIQKNNKYSLSALKKSNQHRSRSFWFLQSWTTFWIFIFRIFSLTWCFVFCLFCNVREHSKYKITEPGHVTSCSYYLSVVQHVVFTSSLRTGHTEKSQPIRSDRSLSWSCDSVDVKTVVVFMFPGNKAGL